MHLWELIAMRISIFLLMLFLSSCEHISRVLQPISGSIIKAIVHGAIKGTVIHCEKAIEVVGDKWEIMCKIDDDMDIKYRTIKLNDEDIRFEFVIDKQKGAGTKTIASPIMLVSKNKPAQLIAENSKSRLEFRVERIK